jgi:hypothetical protein
MARRPPDRGPDAPDEVASAVQILREYHAMGQRSLERDPSRLAVGSELLRASRRFARAYGERDLERLIRRCERYRMALGRTYVDRFVTIVDNRERSSLEEEVIRGRWSRLVLDLEIRRRYGRRRRAGRKPHVPADVPTALSDLFRVCLRITRWGDMIQAEDAAISLDDLPELVRRRAVQTFKAAGRLQAAVEEALQHEIEELASEHVRRD